MLGIWFNHADRVLRTKKHEDFTCLKRFGFTDAFLCIKGGEFDMRDIPERHAHLDLLFQKIRDQDIRVHGMFICSEDRGYIGHYPDSADTTVLGRKSDLRISHVDPGYLEHLTSKMLSAVQEYSLDGIQFDFLRYGHIGNGWSQEEENIYRTFGVDVHDLKETIRARYDVSKPQYNLEPVFSRYWNGDQQVCGFAAARRSVIRKFLETLSGNIRAAHPDIELSVAMMPEGLYPPMYDFAELHYGQWYEDFYPYVDYMVPMIYSGVFEKDAVWTGELAKRAEEQFPGTVIGIAGSEPMTSTRLREDLSAMSGRKYAGISFFRYGRMILMIQDGQDTLLYNTYPGTVNRFILSRDGEEEEKNCNLEEASWLRIPGCWDLIRAFGAFRTGEDRYFEGELCVLDRRYL